MNFFIKSVDKRTKKGYNGCTERKIGDIMKIHITKTAIKEIKRLDVPTRERVLDGIKKLPDGDVKRLQGYMKYYRLRIGNLRIIYSVENNNIIVSAVLPRGEVYKHI